MPARQCLGAADVGGISIPDLAGARLMVAADAAGGPPQDENRTGDLAPGREVLGVHLEIDAEGGAIVLTDRVDRLRVAEAAHILGQRLLAEELEPLRGLGELL